jgi:hypothetical protein
MADSGKQLPVRKLVEKNWICQFRPTSLDLSWDLLKTIQEEVYSFTKLTGRLQLVS